jgi:predicted esterase
MLAGCTEAGGTVPSDGLVSHTAVAPDKEEVVVQGGGRAIQSLVLLPSGDTPDAKHPLLLAIHNFAGDHSGFTELIHAERLRKQGMVIVLPQAAGWVAQWEGPGLTLLDPFLWLDATQHDDVAGLIETLAAVLRRYPLDPADVNVVGFSQGATVALQLTRALDARRPGAVRRLFLVAGSAGLPLDGSLAMPGTDVVTYQPGHNGPQAVANFMAGEPDERQVVGAIIDAKGCASGSQSEAAGVVTTNYQCRDGRSLTYAYEAAGEHSWPRQDEKFDSWLMGRGSGSAVDFTGLIAAAVGGKD